MNSKCVFWNEILPAFIPETVDIKEDAVIRDIQEKHENEEDYDTDESEYYE